MEQPFTKTDLVNYIDERGYVADVDSMWDWYVRNEFKYPLGRCICKIKNWKNDVNLKLRSGKFGAHKKGEKPKTKKVKLYPIKGLLCTYKINGKKCGMPAVYNANPDDYFPVTRCPEHMPEKVKEKYQ